MKNKYFNDDQRPSLTFLTCVPSSTNICLDILFGLLFLRLPGLKGLYGVFPLGVLNLSPGIIEKNINNSSIQVLDHVAVLLAQERDREVVPLQYNFGSRSFRKKRVPGEVLT